MKMEGLSNKLLFGLILGIILTACQQERLPDLEASNEYAPDLKVGNWWVYEVDSAYVDDFFEPPLDTAIQYRLQEIITDTIKDAANETVYLVKRYKKYFNDTIPYDSMNWQYSETWSCKETAGTFERIEENVRYVRLTFPILEAKEWDGNAHNTFVPWTYQYQNIHESYTVGTEVFDSTVFVRQRENENLIELENAYEVYAKGVGLIEKQFIDQVKSATTLEVTSGTSMTWKLIDWGE